ncbi:MAG: ComF family protein [Clostridia bacterium]|nr:ComF family protein [Clostridia bacterium]
MKAFWKACLRTVFPRRCIYCGAVTEPDALSCERCEDLIPVMEEPVCYRCGRTRRLCTCKGHRRRFERCVAAMRYEDGAKRAVLRLKYDDSADLIETMAEEMVKALRARVDAARLDMVTFVPLYPKEHRRRGYNQGEYLAKEVADLLGIPCVCTLKKVYETPPQKSLPRVQRSGNLMGVFDVVADVREQNILLVDDLTTTGATLDECAKMLKLFDAQSVTALTFAAAVPSENEDETD